MRRTGPAATVRVLMPSTLTLALACAFGLATPAHAQPSGAVAVHGSVSLSQPAPQQLLVTTTNGAGTQHSVTNWQSFSIPGGHLTHIAQPSTSSLSINRVVAANPSLIYGTLSSNGQVLLVNPAGITVGAGAVVDTAGFLASTLALSEADAIAGRLRFEGGGAPLQVDGQIVAREGDVVLVAPQLATGAQAVLRADNGSVVLAAGQQVGITGRGLEGIQLQVQAPTDRAVNLGTLQGDAVGIFAGTLRHSGLIQATAVSSEGGRVWLKAQERAEVGGTTRATQGDRGGVVHVTGREVYVAGDALLDVSGAAGGGELLVGGGWQGGDARLANATTTTIDFGARLLADATQQGNGGTVVVWADDTTRYGGHVSARGGSGGGDGGQVEVSGKQNLLFRGTADLSAPAGEAGQLLLDPTNIVIGTTASGTPTGVGTPIGLPDATAPGALTWDSIEDVGDWTIRAADVASLLSGGVVTLQASNNIDVNADLVIGGPQSLTLQAGNKITLASNLSGAGDLTLTAGNGGIQQTAGAVTVGGDVTLNASGNVNLLRDSNAIQYLAGTISNGGSFTLHNGGASTLTLNTMNVAGNFTVNATGTDVNQGGALVVGGVTTFNLGSGGGNLSLSNAGNDLNVFGATSNGLNLTELNGVKLNAIDSGDDVTITAGGALTRNAGTLTSGGTVDLTGSSIGSSSDALVINPDGSVDLTVTAAGGGIYVRQVGSLNLNNYSITTTGSSETVKLIADDILVNSSIGGFVSTDVLSFTALTGDVTLGGNLSLTAQSLEFVAQGGSGGVVISGSGTADVSLTTTAGVTIKTTGGNLTQIDDLVLSGGALTLAVGGNVTLNNAGNTLGSVSGSASGTATLNRLTAIGSSGFSAGGNLTLTSSGNLDINGAAASSGGTLSATSVNTLTLAAAGSVSGSQITLTSGTLNLDGKLYPGRDGVAGGQLSLNGATTFGATSQLHLDFNGSSYDQATSANPVSFVSGAQLFAKLAGAPPVGSFTVFNGDTQGSLPTLAGNLGGAALSLGSVILSVAAPPLTQTATTTPLFEQEVGTAGSGALPETVIDPVQELALADDDIVVDDVSCRPR